MNLNNLRQPTETNNMCIEDLTAMLNKIKDILSREYPRLNSYDQAIVKNEDVVKVITGTDYHYKDMGVLFSRSTMERRKLTTPLQDLMEEINVLQSTQLNIGILRTVFALMLNGRVADLQKSLKSSFPEYH